MRFDILSIVAITATLPSVCLSAPTDSAGIVPRDDTVAIIGTYEDGNCGVSKVDDSITVPYNEHYSACKDLRGKSMQIFWEKKGCTILLFKSRGCNTNPTNPTSIVSGWNQCFNNSQYVSWMGYCW